MPENGVSRNLLTLKLAAEYAGCHEYTIRKYIKQGLLSEIRRGPRGIRVDAAELDTLTRVVAVKTV